jgi:hypothetical protein
VDLGRGLSHHSGPVPRAARELEHSLASGELGGPPAERGKISLPLGPGVDLLILGRSSRVVPNEIRISSHTLSHFGDSLPGTMYVWTPSQFTSRS